MRLRQIKISNFKAIKSTPFELADFTVIVGANGSGKSSALQAMHWMFQSGRNPNIEARRPGDGSTLSERYATYMPSPEYRNSGHEGEYGNRQDSPQLGMAVRAELEDGSFVDADMWIKSARNEGLSVHVPSGNAFTARLRDKREFSAYIPGLAGIPLSEEKRAKLIVHRLAAAGDANTVLRNVLYLLREIEVDGVNGLSLLQQYVSDVMGRFALHVKFVDGEDAKIHAEFQSADMHASDPKRFKPLELAGIGFLQVIQIFAYLLYFRPVVILVDEPDSHLHPPAQERLVTALAAAASKLDTQVILTTHSPSVVRALPPGAHVIWMKGGDVQPKGNNEGRTLMGWGLLDRKILLMTEDTDTAMLQALLSQWPELDRLVAIWPFHGSSKLPQADVINGLVHLTGATLKVVLHRDRDFLMPREITALTEPYEAAGQTMWCTQNADIEAYWNEGRVIAAHYGIPEEDATDLLREAVRQKVDGEKALTTRRKKRNDAITKFRGALPHYGDAEVEAEAMKYGDQHVVLGKDLMGAIRLVAQNRKLKAASVFGYTIPDKVKGEMGCDLKDLLQTLLG